MIATPKARVSVIIQQSCYFFSLNLHTMTQMTTAYYIFACALAWTFRACSAAPLTQIGPALAVDARAFAYDGGDVAYVLGANTLSAITLRGTPSVTPLDDLSDIGPCDALSLYKANTTSVWSSATRLAIVCAGSNTFATYGVEPTRAKRLFTLANEKRIAGVRSVVVVDRSLAFVAAEVHSRVVAVSLDVHEKRAPEARGNYQLSSVREVTKGVVDRQTIRVTSGTSRRVTTLKYSEAGTLQLVGSVKDSRLDGAVGSCVGVDDGKSRTYTYVVSSQMKGGTLSILDSSEFGAPLFIVGMHAGGDREDWLDWSPHAHEDLRGASDVSVFGDDAYIAASDAGAIVVVDVRNVERPVVKDKLASDALSGVNRIEASPDGKFILAVVPRGANADPANADSGVDTVIVASTDDDVIAAAPSGRRRSLFSM
jgi:hypothetical protein